MPYLNKSELEHIVMSAFNKGVIAGVGLDHKENTPEQLFYSLDFDELYSHYFTKKKDVIPKWVVYHKYRGYLSENEETGQYYSEEVNNETYKFDREDHANLLCDIYEKPVKV